ncbi:MAG: type III pantothenate kinase [Ignavibacteria bacterium]|nr:type III pantothenate kinase [Ignavibacteria bacterium]
MATLYDTMIEINSVSYGIAAIDVGNSRVKIHHDDVFLSFPYDKEWKKNVQHHFRDHVQKRYIIGLSSVNHKQTTAIVKVLQRITGHQVVNAHTLLMRNESLLSLSKIENAGIDRMLGAIGAIAKFTPPVVTIDCGTAVTVNAVSTDRQFLGGVIFAGLNTQLFGLSKQTVAIQEMRYTPATEVVGVNTTQCLMSGVTNSVVGGICQTINSYTQVFGKAKPTVVLTGGEAPMLIDRLTTADLNIHHEPHLVTDGILSLVANATHVDIHDSVIKKIT